MANTNWSSEVGDLDWISISVTAGILDDLWLESQMWCVANLWSMLDDPCRGVC